MYRKLQIETVESSLIYLKYVLDINSIVTVQVINPATFQVEYTLERVDSITSILRTDQFTIDEDLSAIILNLANRGKTILITYYTDGTLNPYYASSNLHIFISKVLKWTDNRVIDGLYLYWEECADTESDLTPVRKIKEGSFVYDGRYYVYGGGYWDIREYSPPTVTGYYKAYEFFINSEIIDSYLNPQTQVLANIGILVSASMYKEVDKAKLDVMTLYDNMYESEPLVVCYAYIYLSHARKYELWIEYPKECRTL